MSQLRNQIKELLTEEDIDDIDDIDDSEPTELTVVEYEEVPSNIVISDEDSPEEKDRKDDYKFARTIYKGLLKRGIGSLDDALIMAKDAEHPKAYEAVAMMMKSIASINKELVNIHENKKKGTELSKSVTNNTQVNNYNVSNDKGAISDFLDGEEDDNDENEEES